MRIATCNVNGIRAAARKGMGRWIGQADADILLLQEVRAPVELVPALIGEGYEVIAEACRIKGRAGVAVAVRRGIETGQVRAGLEYDADAGEPDVDSGRWLEVELPGFGLTVVSAYLHSGDAKSEEKMAAKYFHLDAVTARIGQLRAEGRAVVAGDFNIVRSEGDIKNWKPNHNRTAGVLDEEIAYLDAWFGEFGLVDVHRELTGEARIAYTWWSQRGKAFENDAGWRIDYQMATRALADLARAARVDRAPSREARFSDHAPLVVDYEL